MFECSAYAGSRAAVEPDVVIADAETKMPEQISDDRDLEDVGVPEEAREENLPLGRSLKDCRTCQVCRLLSAAAGDAVGFELVSHVEESLAVGDGAGIEMVSRVVEDQAAKDRKSLVVDWMMAFVGGCHGARS